MLKGIQKAASGMIPQLKKQEISANNIANATTPGFKKDSTFIKELDSATKAAMPKRSDWEQPMIDQIYTDYSQGTFNKTGNPLDVAIDGEGFFILETIDGTDRQYSRNGSFSIDTEGFLVNSDGMRILGDGGPIAAGTGSSIMIDESGQVIIDGNVVGSLSVVDFADKSALRKTGATGFIADETLEPIPSDQFTIRQGYLEQSNINVIKEMVGMIITMRNFETASKLIQTQDDSLQTLFNEVGKTRI
ncbi:MAG: flagellar basal-body rod protein FlgF [candidate division Zixibacteria bacterium]|nr:flagellar basal-body rod protein FlgF [candidate division Zixibacteria bacterium]